MEIKKKSKIIPNNHDLGSDFIFWVSDDCWFWKFRCQFRVWYRFWGLQKLPHILQRVKRSIKVSQITGLFLHEIRIRRLELTFCLKKYAFMCFAKRYLKSGTKPNQIMVIWFEIEIKKYPLTKTIKNYPHLRIWDKTEMR